MMRRERSREKEVTTADATSPSSFFGYSASRSMAKPSTAGNWSKHHIWDNSSSSRAIGLGLVDALSTEGTGAGYGMVVFGSQLKTQNPQIPPPLMDCGNLFMEMELSEDYTCVIYHGPNPKRTHIFENNCIVESCEDGVLALRKESSSSDDHLVCATDGSLSCSGSCEGVGKGKPISINREASCSHEYHRVMLPTETTYEADKSV